MSSLVLVVALAVCGPLAAVRGQDPDELDAAIAAAEERLRTEPEAGSVYLELALLHGLAGHRDVAKRMRIAGITLSGTVALADAEVRLRARAFEEPVPAIIDLRDEVIGAVASKEKCDEAERTMSTDPEQALALCEQALYGSPENAEVYLVRGRLQLLLPGGGEMTLLDVVGEDDEARARAVVEYDRAIELCPVYADAYLARADAREDRRMNFLAGDSADVPDEVMADVDKAVELAPNRATAFRVRAGLLRRKHAQAVRNASEREPYDGSFAARARADLTRVIELVPGSVDAYLERARFELEVYESEAALADLDKILQELAPGDMDALELRSEFYLRDLQWEELVGALTALLEHQSTTDHHDLRGETYLRLAEPERALADFDASLAAAAASAARILENEAIPQDTKDEFSAQHGAHAVRTHVGRGRALAALGRTEEALAAFATAEELAPESPEPHQARGELRQALGDTAGARLAFDRAIALADPTVCNAPKARLELLRAAYSAGKQDFDRALEGASQAAHLDPTYTAAVALEAQLLLGRQELARARDPLERWIALAPRDADAYAARARLHAAEGQIEPALADFARATELRANDPGLWSAYGELAFQTGDVAKAILCFERVAAFAPEHAQTKLLLAVLHGLAGDADAARRWLADGLARATPDETRQVSAVAAQVLAQRPDAAVLAEIAAQLAAAAQKP